MVVEQSINAEREKERLLSVALSNFFRALSNCFQEGPVTNE